MLYLTDVTILEVLFLDIKHMQLFISHQVRILNHYSYFKGQRIIAYLNLKADEIIVVTTAFFIVPYLGVASFLKIINNELLYINHYNASLCYFPFFIPFLFFTFN